MPWAGFSLGRRRPANLERPTLCRRPWAESAVVAGMLAGFVWAHFSPPTAADLRHVGEGNPRVAVSKRARHVDLIDAFPGAVGSGGTDAHNAG